MLETLEGYLEPGETIIAAVYCVYKPTGFFASNVNMTAGYAALTDRDRFVGCKMGIINITPVVMDMAYLTKIKISNVIFGQKSVHMVFQQDKKHEVKLQISPKILTSKFPNQQSNTERILNELKAKQEMLS